MNMSESIAELATALSKAQGQIDAAVKGNVNLHFKSRYADLNALREVIREPLAVNDLSIVQLPRFDGKNAEVETLLLHKSGQFLSETLRMPVAQLTAQAVGSAITYCRRYSLSSILNLAADDDDGNAASAGAPASNINIQPVKSAGQVAAKKGSAELAKWYRSLSKDERDAIQQETGLIESLKSSANQADQKSDAE